MTNEEIGLGSERYSGITNEAIGLGSPQYSGIDINKAIMVSGRNQFSRVAPCSGCGHCKSKCCTVDDCACVSCPDLDDDDDEGIIIGNGGVYPKPALKRKAGLIRPPKRSLSRVKLLAKNISRFSHVTVAEIESDCYNKHLSGMGPPTFEQQDDYDACVKQQKRQRFFDLIYSLPSIFTGGRPGAITDVNAGNGDDEDDKPTTPWGLIIGIPVAILVLFLGYKAVTAKGK